MLVGYEVNVTVQHKHSCRLYRHRTANQTVQINNWTRFQCIYLPGSVRQKAATCSPEASLGRYFCFWASFPAIRIPWKPTQQFESHLKILGFPTTQWHTRLVCQAWRRRSILFLPSVQWLDVQPGWQQWSRLMRWSQPVVRTWCWTIPNHLKWKKKDTVFDSRY